MRALVTRLLDQKKRIVTKKNFLQAIIWLEPRSPLPLQLSLFSHESNILIRAQSRLLQNYGIVVLSISRSCLCELGLISSSHNSVFAYHHNFHWFIALKHIILVIILLTSKYFVYLLFLYIISRKSSYDWLMFHLLTKKTYFAIKSYLLFYK